MTCAFFTPRQIKASCYSPRGLCVFLCTLSCGKKTRETLSRERKELHFWHMNVKPYCLICQTRALLSSSFITLLIDRSKNSKFPRILSLSPEPQLLALIYYSFPYCFFILHPLTENYVIFPPPPRTCLHSSEAQDWPRLAVRKLGNGICINPTRFSFTCLWGDSWGGHCQSTPSP